MRDYLEELLDLLTQEDEEAAEMSRGDRKGEGEMKRKKRKSSRRERGKK